MDIIRWRPMMDMDRWFDGDVPSSFLSGAPFTPAVDVYQTKDVVIVETPLAGIDPEKVNISVEKKTEIDEKNYYRKEIRTGMFHRSVALPTAVNGEQADATYDKGMLKISIPKAEHVKPKSIKVKVVKSS